MKKKVYRERYQTLILDKDKYYNFIVDDLGVTTKEGTIEKEIKKAMKKAKKKVDE